MSQSPGKFRLITRSDFDGLVCAILLREINLIDDELTGARAGQVLRHGQ